MLTTLVSITILGFLSQSKAQPLRNRDDIGLFNGRLVGIDNVHLPAHADLRTFLGINQLPVVPAQGGVITGGIPNVGLTAVVPIAGRRLRRCQKDTCERRKISDQCKYTPILKDMSGQFCRGCDQDVCLDLDLLGRGRDGINGRSGRSGINGRSDRNERNGRRQEDKEARKRLRKIRRRICRSQNVCLGDSQREVMQGQIKRTLLGGAPGSRSGLGNQSPILGRNIIGGQGPVLGGGLPILGGGILGGQGPLMGGGVLGNQRPIMGVGIVGGQPPLMGGLLGNQQPVLGGLLGNIIGQPQIPAING